MAIIFGFLAAAFALIIELLALSFPSLTETVASAPLSVEGGMLTISIALTIILGVLIEEASKYLFLIRYRILRFQEGSLGRMLGAGLFFGLGFSLPEAWSAWHALGFVAAPIAGIILIHIVTSLILATVTLSDTRRGQRVAAFGLALLLHAAYNITAYAVFPAY